MWVSLPIKFYEFEYYQTLSSQPQIIQYTLDFKNENYRIYETDKYFFNFV